MNIPVFHDDQHGTAVMSTAAIVSWLKLTGKKEEIKLVISGAAPYICRPIGFGFRENVFMGKRASSMKADRGIGIRVTRAIRISELLPKPWKVRTSSASHGDCVTQDMVKQMAPNPLFWPWQTQIEIHPDLAREARPDAIIGTGRSDSPTGK